MKRSLVVEKRVGGVLAQIRSDLGLTQKEVGAAADLCQRTISLVERGDRPTLMRYVVAIAEAMGYQVMFVPSKKNQRKP